MSSAVDRLQAVLAAEHATIFGYGALGPHLSGSAQRAAGTAEQAHRDRRDAVAAMLIASQARPVAVERAYTLPFPVTSATDALKLAIRLEERTAAAWRAAVPDLDTGARRTAVTALGDCASQAARWRRRLAPDAPATVAFPGV